MHIGLKIWELIWPIIQISETGKAFKHAVKSPETILAGNARFKNWKLVLFSRKMLRILIIIITIHSLLLFLNNII